jgi:phosphosulfolactate synthase (CoM biosynthesis protein A)
MPRRRVQELNHLAHQHEAYVSTGGWIEHVLARGGPEDVARYIGEAQALGFDLVELSTGFITLPTDDLIELVKAVKAAGLKAKPEFGISSAPAARPERRSSPPKEEPAT